ncbi:MAG: hypothetical protein WCR52_18395 [Bacteroidota bacterium]
MKHILTTFILTICSLTIFAQDKITDELKSLMDNEQYDKVISQYASAARGLRSPPQHSTAALVSFPIFDTGQVRPSAHNVSGQDL